MRFKRSDSSIPTIDLIPMLTVMMGVLAFFVVISVSLSNDQRIQVELPPEQTENPPNSDSITDPFIVAMDAEGQQLLNGVPVTTDQLVAEVNAYLERNSTSTVYLVPSRKLPYEQVMRFLGEMRAVGGDRISLALDKGPDEGSDEALDEAIREP